MWAQLRQFRSLESPVRRSFLLALVLLPLISLSLRFRGFLKTRAFLQRHLSSPRPQKEPYSICPKLTARMVRAAGRYGLQRPTCLQESLALWCILGRQGIPCDLRVGVRKQAERFEAHAWVERLGVPLNEPEGLHRHYAAFDAALASISAESR
jgi:Transglutaminase-like superfamily